MQDRRMQSPQAALLFEWDSREPLCIVTLPIEKRFRQELREYAIFLCMQLTVVAIVGYDKLTLSIDSRPSC